MDASPKPRAKIALAFFAILIGVGTIGYRLIEGWRLTDCLYMTIITLATVGFGEVHPLSTAGRLFTSALILLGVGTLAYAATKTTEAIVERAHLRRRRRMLMDIRKLTNQIIVCGYGRMGRSIVAQLAARKIPHVVIERGPEPLADLEAYGILHVIGDATDDAILNEAGVQNARAVAAVLPNDAENLFVTVSVRTINPNITIIARSSSRKNHSKLLAAGATRVVDPYVYSSHVMVRHILHPAVTEFIDAITDASVAELELEEFQLAPASPLAGVALRDTPIRREMNVIVVGIRRGDRGLLFNPPADHVPEAGDIMIVLGQGEGLRRLAQLTEGRAG